MTIKIIKPTEKQIEWAECEIGVIIHFDIQVFEPTYKFRENWGYTPSPEVFNPSNLNTDQWLKTVNEMGAKYAVLVVNHCSGFCLWPSNNYDYCIKNSPYKNGKGDIVQDFIESCKKYNILPGLYYSTVCNAYKLFDQPGKRTPEIGSQEFNAYCDLVINQLTELWTQYGEIFEIWFDGGSILGGPDITELLKKYQPNAICFQGPKGWHQNLRWVGNERGKAPYPCWSTSNPVEQYDESRRQIRRIARGDPNGKIWMPAETDTPNRTVEWFWYENQENLVKPAEDLVKAYYRSVGRNTNLLLGMVIDNRGLVPEADAQEFIKFGKELKKRFNNPIAEMSGDDKELILNLPQLQVINQILLMEDIKHGELVRKYTIERFTGETWISICEGSCIGHKKIEIFESIEVNKIRLTIVESVQIPKIRKLAVYNVEKIDFINL